MNFKYSLLLPKKFSEWFIQISLLIFLIAFCFFLLVRQNMTECHTLQYWLLRVIGIAFAVWTTSVIVFGIREARINGITFRNLIIPVLGVICLLAPVLLAWSIKTMVNNISVQQTIRLDCFKKKIEGTGLPIDKEVAKIYYRVYGEQREYSTPDGTNALYEPTEEDRNKYEQHLSTIKTGEWIVSSMHSMQLYWLTVCGISLLLGFIIPIRRRR
jgi:hypothetical protein